MTDVREEQDIKQLSPKLVTEEGMVTDVRDERKRKHLSPKLVTAKDTSLYVTLSGTTTSVAEPLYFESTAVFVSVSNLYLKPSVVLYSMTSAFITMLIMAKRETSMSLNVTKFFIYKSFLPMAPFRRLVIGNVVVFAYIYKERGASSVTRSTF